jgi:hypothetical protein
MSLIIPANSLASGGYAVDNSLRFNDGSSDYLTRTPSSTSNQKTWTVSCWVKRSKLSSNQYVWGVNGDTNGDYFTELLFNSSDELEFRQGGTVGDPYQTQYKTNRLFRDVSAWYHIVIAADTTNGTEADRLKIWINGVQETSFATTNHPSLNENFRWHFVSGSNYPHSIGRSGRHSTNYFGGYIAEWIDVDGSQLDATSFGEFDEDSGIWKPIDVSGLTFGTNGAYLDFEDSAALGDDVSGNGNDFTVNNLTAIDQTTDTPTNNFATGNPLIRNKTYNDGSLAEGNTYFAPNGRAITCSTIGVTSGKWYAEFKTVDAGALIIGVGDLQLGIQANQGNPIFYDNNPSYALGLASGGNLEYNGTTTSYGSYADGNIVGVALDMDNHALYFSVNGTWQNSGDPTSGASKTGDATSEASYNPLDDGGEMFMFVSDFSAAGVGECFLNFGNPAFTISSGNTDGNGYGNFEYAVPSGYLSLCTKNLSEVLG